MAGLDVSDLPNVARAMAIIDAVPVAPRVETVALHEAQGRRLAEEIVADRDYPPFEKALMDGYAVRCADVASTPAELHLVGEIAAGNAAERTLAAGEAMAIMTGAPMPAGADGVVPIEQTERGEKSDEPGRIRILGSTTPGRYIAKQGSDVRAGAPVLRRGAILEAAQLAVAASVGAQTVKVFARPRVAVLSTGDELVPIDQPPGPSQIRNSNNIMLLSLLRRWAAP